jgi:hypothetical protein
MRWGPEDKESDRPNWGGRSRDQANNRLNGRRVASYCCGNEKT